LSERPEHRRPRRLADWINPTGVKKVHSLIDKVYKRKNLQMAWEQVKANRGAGGVDGQTLEEFEAQSEQHLDRLHRDLKEETYRPEPVRQVTIPKAGKPGEFGTLGIPTVTSQCTSVRTVSECLVLPDSAGVADPVPKFLFVGRV
jgi:RNA-directed DNA polymerase